MWFTQNECVAEVVVAVLLVCLLWLLCSCRGSTVDYLEDDWIPVGDKLCPAFFVAFGKYSCLFPVYPAPRRDSVCCQQVICFVRCSHCLVDPGFQFVVWLVVWNVVEGGVAVCVVAAFFLLVGAFLPRIRQVWHGTFISLFPYRACMCRSTKQLSSGQNQDRSERRSQRNGSRCPILSTSKTRRPWRKPAISSYSVTHQQRFPWEARDVPSPHHRHTKRSSDTKKGPELTCHTPNLAETGTAHGEHRHDYKCLVRACVH